MFTGLLLGSLSSVEKMCLFLLCPHFGLVREIVESFIILLYQINVKNFKLIKNFLDFNYFSYRNILIMIGWNIITAIFKFIHNWILYRIGFYVYKTTDKIIRISCVSIYWQLHRRTFFKIFYHNEHYLQWKITKLMNLTNN